ncbi:MAG TPA: hypothetical protein VFS42_09195 [Burkholderiaceae bacterium]|nr:hypothetical protein [Burkholderiaceae bacterium]
MTSAHVPAEHRPDPLIDAFSRLESAIDRQRDALAGRDTDELTAALNELEGAIGMLGAIAREANRLGQDQRSTFRSRVHAASVAMRVQRVALARLQAYADRGLIDAFGLQGTEYDRSGQKSSASPRSALWSSA